MKKHFKWVVKNGRVLLLQRSVGFFGEQWECFCDFDEKDGNVDRAKLIIKKLNECARHTDKYNSHE